MVESADGVDRSSSITRDAVHSRAKSSLHLVGAFFKGLWADATARRLVFWATGIFLGLIAVHLTLAVGAALRIGPLEMLWDNGTLRLDVDNSLPEIVEYLALATAIYFLFRSGINSGAVIFYAFVLVNLYILIDAVFRIHEQLGGAINPDEIWKGQLTFFAIVGTVLLCTLMIGVVKSTPQYRRLAGIATLPLIGLFGAAVLVDAIHTIVKLEIIEAAQMGTSNRNADYLQGAIAVLEDGGELFFLLANAVVCYWIFRLVSQRHR